ncbi:hypothetical protein FFLO_01035 [Filobasidium floriforme]|uniref:Uncharacterized protein n=1 Tax=Filobasidium floriforme TaxID=5210 RepID=A0A8K0JQG8_9TREE|nr:uncharacterized protein HD553DRAFT_325421 [Filobasidium floriforme]KAG7571071.1 hypothetical protein FFLO_01035 [Filobasidium floriforme]KAH8081374.1 hypothetical protein HD553DRAFT_325421 [Filobasidium floriforme]
MAPLGTDILLLGRYLASSSRSGHRGRESRYSTYSYPDEDQYSTYCPRPSACRVRNGARTHHEPRRRKHRRTRPVTSPPFATRDNYQEQQYRESAEPRSPRPAKPHSQYAHDDSYASGRVSPASSHEDFEGEETHQYEDHFLCLLCRNNGKALYRIKDRRNTTETRGLPYFVFYDPQTHRILPPDTDRGPSEERATDGHACDDHFDVLSRAALQHGWNEEAPTPRKMDYSTMFQCLVYMDMLIDPFGSGESIDLKYGRTCILTAPGVMFRYIEFSRWRSRIYRCTAQKSRYKPRRCPVPVGSQAGLVAPSKNVAERTFRAV